MDSAPSPPPPTNKQLSINEQLIEYAQSGDVTNLSSLFSNPDLNVDYKDQAGSTALSYACNFGHESVVKILLENNADPNVQDKVEWTPLMWAVNNNYLNIVKMLLEAHADPKIRTNSGRSALDLPISETSATYIYLQSLNILNHKDFYKPVDDESLGEEPDFEVFSTEPSGLSPSMQGVDLGINVDELGGDDMAPLSLPSAIHVNEFDWDNFKIKDSLPLNRDRIPELLDMCITNFKPTLDKHQLPLSADTLFLAFRYQLYCGTQDGFTTITTPVVRRIMLVCEEDEHCTDLAFLNYWLANSEVLLYYVKRDAKMATETQGSFMPSLARLVRFLCESIYKNVVNMIEPLIAPSILHFDSIPEYGQVTYRDEWKLFKPKVKDDRAEQAQKHLLPPSPDVLVKNPGPQKITSLLSSVLLLFQIYGVHSTTQMQLLFKLLYYICISTFNEVVSHRRFCTRRRAMQIRLNISVLEDWCRNQNFRPESVDFDKQYRFKSLIDVGRTSLAPIVQILAWLQTFSAFGTDFTNVVSTLQELKALNPKQLLHTACQYRFETKESPLSKEYKHYLQDLVTSYERRLVTEKLETQAIEGGELPSQNQNEDANQDLNQDANQDGNTTETMNNVDSLTSDLRAMKYSYINIDYTLPVPDDVKLPELPFVERTPTLKECEQFWGTHNLNLNTFVQAQGGRYCTPRKHELVAELFTEENETTDTIPNQLVETIQPAIKPEEGYDEFFDDDIGPVW